VVGRESGQPLVAATRWPRTRPILTGLDRPTKLSQREPLVARRHPRRLVPIAAAADYLSVSRATIERLVNRGELPVVKVAGTTRYDVEDLDLYIAANKCRNRTRTASEA
jgi:excisionase family DNA binding protein